MKQTILTILVILLFVGTFVAGMVYEQDYGYKLVCNTCECHCKSYAEQINKTVTEYNEMKEFIEEHIQNGTNH